jgi:hypothetical protein
MIMADKLKACRHKFKSVRSQLEFYAMRRSGHHAIMHWIFAQIKEPIYFHNDIICHKPPNMYVDRGRIVGKGSPFPTNLPYFAFNCEDSSLARIKEHKKDSKSLMRLKSPKKLNKILILRDPFNLFASRIRLFDRNNTIRKEEGKGLFSIKRNSDQISEIGWADSRMAERWKEHAREFLGEASLLEGSISISYNEWFSSEDYRKQISKKLGLDFSDKGILKVPSNGLGSSFDLTTKSGKAQEMKVLSRWEKYIKDDRFLTLFDDELLDLSYKIYPELTSKVSKILK